MGKQDREEIIYGRVVVFPQDTAKQAFYKDTGDVYDAAAAELLGISGAIIDPKLAFDFSGKRPANPPIVFWVPEYKPGEDPRAQPRANPLRGFILSIFRKPEVMTRNDKKDDDKDEGTEGEAPKPVRTKLSSYVLLTAATMVRNGEKKIVVAHPGSVVWVDLYPAVSAAYRQYAPKRDAQGRPVEIYEVAVDPLYTLPFGNQGHRVWKMDFYNMGRTLNAQQINAIAKHFVVPPVPGDDDLVEIEAPRLAASAAPVAALPENAGASANGTPPPPTS